MNRENHPWADHRVRGGGRRAGPLATCARLVLVTAALGLVPGSPTAEAAASPARHYADLSLEELMNETVTSVSKREEKLADAPAAVTVITNDDLQREGATMVADTLRFVPGMEVGAANAQEWAVSARGFNQVYSNKLLVLIDGRAVYSPLFGGVFWDLQQQMLEDVDRIEVIRGPGATIWGANAVNGVVNVVTRSARDTLGGMAYTAAGDGVPLIAGVRQGFRLGPHTCARIFASYQDFAELPLSNGGQGEDGWIGRHAGFRVDDESDTGRILTWQAEGTSAMGATSDNYNVNTLVRWTQPVAGTNDSIELQGYFDRLRTDQEIRGRQTTDTLDFAAQHNWSIAENYDVVWGTGARLFRGTIGQTSPNVFIRNPRFERHLLSAFVQARRVFPGARATLTGGLKVEHNSYTGFELQPTLRATWKPSPHTTLWAAISRAARTPGEIEAKDTLGIILGAPLVGPDGRAYLPAIVGSRDLRSEILNDGEVGGRFQLTERATVDITGFYDDYERLVSYRGVERLVPCQPFGIAEMPWRNLYGAYGVGGEIALTIAPAEHWRVGAMVSCVDLHVRDELPSGYPNTFIHPPHQQAGVRAAFDFNPRTSADLGLRHVGSTPGTPDYTAADLRIAYRPTPAIELTLIGQNLLDPHHLEQAPIALTPSSEVPRRIYVRLTYRH